MEIVFVILSIVWVALAVYVIYLLCYVDSDERKLKALAEKVEFIKNALYVNDYLNDRNHKKLLKCSAKVDDLEQSIRITDANVSKMADELLKLNDLNNRLIALQDDFTDLARDFKAFTTLGSTQPYTQPSQEFYGLDGRQNLSNEVTKGE